MATLCTLCLDPIVQDDPIQQTCNHPLEKHYCCAPCRKKYEEENLKTYAKKRDIFSQSITNQYPQAMFMMTSCPCKECKYLYTPTRNGSSGWKMTENIGKTSLGCLYYPGEGNLYYKSHFLDRGETPFLSTVKSYEIAHFQEGRLHGKYLIITLLMCDLSNHNDPTLFALYGMRTFLPTAVVSVLEMRYGVIQSVNEYLTLKFDAIREYVDRCMAEKIIDTDQIYMDLLGEENIEQNLFVKIQETKYEMNILTYRMYNILVYDQSILFKYERLDHPDTPNSYYVAKKYEAFLTPYLTNEIEKRYVTAISNPGLEDPVDSLLPSGDLRSPKKVDSIIYIRETPYNASEITELYFQYKEFTTDEYGLTGYGCDGKKITTYLFEKIRYVNAPVTLLKCERDVCYITEYYPNGGIHNQKAMWWVSGDYIPDGAHIYYHENGQVKVESHFIQGKREGHLLEYDRYGKLTKCALYKSGKMALLFQT